MDSAWSWSLWLWWAGWGSAKKTFPSDEWESCQFQCGIGNVHSCALSPHESPSTSPQSDHPLASLTLARDRPPQFLGCPRRLDTIWCQWSHQEDPLYRWKLRSRIGLDRRHSQTDHVDGRFRVGYLVSCLKIQERWLVFWFSIRLILVWNFCRNES